MKEIQDKLQMEVNVLKEMLEKLKLENKQDVFNAYNAGWQYGYCIGLGRPITKSKSFRQYYDENFKENDLLNCI